ncbi:MAG: electron transfer flavoprotein subunit alpha, partial [Pseudoflavonifractor sp.]
MKIITCCKVVPDEEQIQVLPNRKLSMENTPWKISQYDLNALEAGKTLAAETGGTMTALSVGGSTALQATKIQKDILSRGPDDLSLVVDDA